MPLDELMSDALPVAPGVAMLPGLWRDFFDLEVLVD
jgi:hypothetical protein